MFNCSNKVQLLNGRGLLRAFSGVREQRKYTLGNCLLNTRCDIMCDNTDNMLKLCI